MLICVVEFTQRFSQTNSSEPEMLSNSDMIPEVIKTALAASANVANTANAPKVEVCCFQCDSMWLSKINLPNS